MIPWARYWQSSPLYYNHLKAKSLHLGWLLGPARIEHFHSLLQHVFMESQSTAVLGREPVNGMAQALVIMGTQQRGEQAPAPQQDEGP